VRGGRFVVRGEGWEVGQCQGTLPHYGHHSLGAAAVGNALIDVGGNLGDYRGMRGERREGGGGMGESIQGWEGFIQLWADEHLLDVHARLYAMLQLPAALHDEASGAAALRRLLLEEQKSFDARVLCAADDVCVHVVY